MVRFPLLKLVLPFMCCAGIRYEFTNERGAVCANRILPPMALDVDGVIETRWSSGPGVGVAGIVLIPGALWSARAKSAQYGLLYGTY